MENESPGTAWGGKKHRKKHPRQGAPKETEAARNAPGCVPGRAQERRDPRQEMPGSSVRGGNRSRQSGPGHDVPRCANAPAVSGLNQTTRGPCDRYCGRGRPKWLKVSPTRDESADQGLLAQFDAPLNSAT